MEEVRTATVAHAIPGRIRVRLDKTLRSPDTVNSLVNALAQVEGMRLVQGNPVTGSLLLLYDPERLNLEQLFAAAQAANIKVIVPEAAAPPPPSGEVSAIATRINAAFSRLDRAMATYTGGKVDVKLLIPAGLAATAMRQIVTSAPNLTAVPWYVLLWYSFDFYSKYNRRPPGTQIGPTD